MSEKILIPEFRFPEFEKDGEWNKKMLEETGRIVTGKTPSTKDASLWDGEILFITPTDIEENKKYQRETARTVVENEKLNTLPVGSIAYTCIASIGKIAITTKESVTNQQINSIIVNKNHDNEFIYYSLLNITPHIKSRPATSTLPIINKTEFSGFKIAIPNPQEQQKIASCLSSLDELLAAHKDKLDALKDHKKGLLQNLFPNRLNHDSKGFKDGHDLEDQKKSSNQVNPGNHGSDNVPKVRFPEFEGDGEWVEKKLGEMTTKIGSGKTPKGGDKNYKSSGRPFVRSQNIGWGILLLDDMAFIDEDTHSTFLSSEIKSNDVLLNITGASIGRSAIANGKVAKGNVNQHVCIIRTKNELNAVFLNQYLISEYGQKQIDSFQAGGNRQGLNFSQIRSLDIPTPPTIQEQQKIASCLSAVGELINAQQEKIEQLQQHKKGLMQGLFPKMSETGFTGLLDDQDFDSDKKSGNQVNQKNHGSDNG